MLCRIFFLHLPCSLLGSLSVGLNKNVQTPFLCVHICMCTHHFVLCAHNASGNRFDLAPLFLLGGGRVPVSPRRRRLPWARPYRGGCGPRVRRSPWLRPIQVHGVLCAAVLECIHHKFQCLRIKVAGVLLKEVCRGPCRYIQCYISLVLTVRVAAGVLFYVQWPVFGVGPPPPTYVKVWVGDLQTV